jgi:hypothetical protein
MGYIGLAAAPALAVVGLFGVIVGAIDVVGLLRVEITTQGGIEGIQGLHIVASRPLTERCPQRAGIR